MKSLVGRVVAIPRWIRRHWKLSLVILLVLGGIGFWLSRRASSEKTAVQFVHPEIGDLTKVLSVSGVIDAKEKASLFFASGGKITRVGAKEGDIVKKYQMIAQIDPSEQNKRLQKDLNTYFNQRMTFEQTLDDNDAVNFTKAIDRANQQNQKDLENSVLDVELRAIAIQNTVLNSPIEGVLVSAPVTVPGSFVSLSDMFQIINPKSLVFRATVDQADIAKVKKGQTVEIILDAFPDDKIKTELNYIAYTSSQSSSGTVYIVEMALPSSENFLPLDHYRLGMNGDADIILAEKKNVLKIPLAATRERDDKTFVTVKTGENTTAEREITVGLETDEDVEVLSGLTEQDEVVMP